MSFFANRSMKQRWAFLVSAVTLVASLLYIADILPNTWLFNREEIAKYEKGRLLFLEGEHDDALGELKGLNSAEALYYMGRIYHVHKDPNKRDYREATRFYREAAQKEHTFAQYYLGYMYFGNKGSFPEKNPKSAFPWYHKAAQAGHVGAQYNVGDMYERGRGVELNLTKAYIWFYLAAEQGHAEAVEKQEEIGKKMFFPNDIVDAEKMARRCLKNNYKGC